MIGEQADAADRIVEKVRAGIRSKSAVRKRFDLAEAADRAVASYRASGKLKAEVVFSSRAPAPVYADPLELELVLLNLIRNADEAMEAAGTRFPKIYLTTEESAGSSSVRVEDDGPAVDLEAFERRADAMESTKDGGLGLGLSIARSLTEAQGGAMRFSRGPRGGVAVTLSFPEDRGPEPEGAGKEKET